MTENSAFLGARPGAVPPRSVSTSRGGARLETDFLGERLEHGDRLPAVAGVEIETRPRGGRGGRRADPRRAGVGRAPESWSGVGERPPAPAGSMRPPSDAKAAHWTTAVRRLCLRTGQIDPFLPFKIDPMNGRDAPGTGVPDVS